MALALVATTVAPASYMSSTALFEPQSHLTPTMRGNLQPTANVSMAPPVFDLRDYIEDVREIYVWLVPVMVCVLSIAVVGNGIIVVSAPWLSRPINPYHRLCVSLAAADTWAASLLVVGLIVNSYLPIVLKQPVRSYMCLAALLEVFRIAGMHTSNLHILALAVHQFVGIVYPLRYKMILTTKRQRFLIITLWLVPFLYIFLWFMSHPDDGFRHPDCQLNFYSRLPFRLSVFVSFIIPLFATFALYTHILFTLIKAKARCNTDLRRSMHENYRRRVKSKLKLVWTTLLILSSFTLSWGLCVLYFVLVCKEGCVFIFLKSVSFQLSFFFNSSVNFLVMIKLVLNPLIYALRMRHIRNSVVACLNTMSLGCFNYLNISSSTTNFTAINGFVSTAGSERPEKNNPVSENEKQLRTEQAGSEGNSVNDRCYIISTSSECPNDARNASGHTLVEMQDVKLGTFEEKFEEQLELLRHHSNVNEHTSPETAVLSDAPETVTSDQILRES